MMLLDATYVWGKRIYLHFLHSGMTFGNFLWNDRFSRHLCYSGVNELLTRGRSPQEEKNRFHCSLQNHSTQGKEKTLEGKIFSAATLIPQVSFLLFDWNRIPMVRQV